MALKHFRRFKYAAADVDRVIKHLKLHKKVTADDIITRPLKKPRRIGKKVHHDEPIPWALAGALKGSWQEASLKPGPKGKLRLYGLEDGDAFKQGQRPPPPDEDDDRDQPPLRVRFP